MTDAFERGRELFLEEARELNSELERVLLELEESPHHPDLINLAFRVMHTIKGSGSMFGFTGIVNLTHEMETIFDQVRQGQREVNGDLISLGLLVHDGLRTMLDGIEGEGKEDSARLETLLRRIADFQARRDDSMAGPVSGREAPANSGGPLLIPAPGKALLAPEALEDLEELEVHKAKPYRISFRPSPLVLQSGINLLSLLQELLELGEGEIVAQTEHIPPLDLLDPEECWISWEILLRTSQGLNAIQDVFVFVEDSCQIKIQELNEEEVRRIGEILIEQGVSEGKVLSALREQQLFRSSDEGRHAEQTKEPLQSSTIRVPFQKLDQLVDLVGELVTVKGRLTQTVARSADEELVGLSQELGRLCGELRDAAMGLRVVPIGSLFGRFKRVVRDLSTELNKEVELTIEGSETELDKSIIERLNDPLVHIIRNSMGHGIEPPEKRVALGKARQGQLCLRARHEGSKVVIEVEDDGKGLNLQDIRRKAVEVGLLRPEVEIESEMLQELIFHPGFSTATEVSNLSGRGVGLDVVRRNVEELGGKLQLWSEQGLGTRLSFRLPLTLSIIEGLLARVGQEYFIFPLSFVQEVVEVKGAAENLVRDKGWLEVREGIVPVLSIRQLFQQQSPPQDIQQVVIVEESDPVGFLVDEVVGSHQTVIKNLGNLYRNVEGLVGATVLGTGAIALILDVARLIQMATQIPRPKYG